MKTTDKLLLTPILILTINFITRLIDFAKIRTFFPLDYTNDGAAYIAILHFLDTYGYFSLIPEWYNGFTLFEAAAPGWYTYAYPFLLLTKDIMLATILSTYSLFILGFIATWLIGRLYNLSKTKRTALFLFIFANPIAIGAYLKQGRFPELLALVLFTFLVYTTLYYKHHRFDKKAIAISLILAAIILTHQYETILATIPLLCLFFTKKKKEKKKLILLIISSIILASPWLIRFLGSLQKTGVQEAHFGSWLLSFNTGYLPGNILLILLPLLTIILLSRQKRGFESYPLYITSILMLTRTITLIPFFKEIPLDPWINLFVIYTSFLFITLPFHQWSERKKAAIGILLTLVITAGVIYNHTQTPYTQEHSNLDKDILSILPEISERYLFVTSERIKDSYPNAYYSYTAIFLGKKTAGGWGDWFKEPAYKEQLYGTVDQYRETKDCTSLKENLDTLNVTEVISIDSDCKELVTNCHFKEKKQQGRACLLSTPEQG